MRVAIAMTDEGLKLGVQCHVTKLWTRKILPVGGILKVIGRKMFSDIQRDHGTDRLELSLPGLYVSPDGADILGLSTEENPDV